MYVHTTFAFFAYGVLSTAFTTIGICTIHLLLKPVACFPFLLRKFPIAFPNLLSTFSTEKKQQKYGNQKYLLKHLLRPSRRK